VPLSVSDHHFGERLRDVAKSQRRHAGYVVIPASPPDHDTSMFCAMCDVSTSGHSQSEDLGHVVFASVYIDIPTKSARMLT
jgi:hypothetical protein